MYVVRTPGYRKRDPVLRWSLPDRVFFACGAWHVLAYAFLERYGSDTGRAIWIKPGTGLPGNHVFVDGGDWAFDYHGHARPGRLFDHCRRKAATRWPNWDAALVELPTDVLVPEAGSLAFDPALHLREPRQFLHDALPRARRFLDRFAGPPA